MWSLGIQYVCRCRARVISMYIGVMKKKRPYSGLDVYFHCLTLLRPRTTSMILLYFKEHSYDVTWDPICVPMYSWRHLNVYCSCWKKRPYSGLDVYFHCLTLFRPRTTPMILWYFIDHSYMCADVEFDAFECLLELCKEKAIQWTRCIFSLFGPI